MLKLIVRIMVYVIKNSVLNVKHWYIWFRMLKASANNDMDAFFNYTEKWLQLIVKKDELLRAFSDI